MRLVEEATHANPGAWPEKLKEYTLTAADSALSDDEKLHLQQKMVISEVMNTPRIRYPRTSTLH